jgi:hypothetical protein
MDMDTREQVLEEELFSLLIDIYRSPKSIRMLADPGPRAH